jgi:translation initiation factor 3 subunit L
LLEIDELELSQILQTYKLNNRQLKWYEGEALSGEYAPVYDLDISLSKEDDGKEFIHVQKSKNVRKFADWFIRNTVKNYNVQDTIEGKTTDQQKAKKTKA